MRETAMKTLTDISLSISVKRPRTDCHPSSTPSPTMKRLKMKKQPACEEQVEIEEEGSEHTYSKNAPSIHIKSARQSLFDSLTSDNTNADATRKHILQEINTQLTSLQCGVESGGSVLYDDDCDDIFSSAFEELRKRVPFLFSILSACMPMQIGTECERVLVCIYAMIMRCVYYHIYLIFI
jgi:hypothetical protein